MLRIRNILYPTDGSALAEFGFAQAVFFAGHHASTLHVLRVEGSARGRSEGSVSNPPSDAQGFRARLHEVAAESVGVNIVQTDMPAASPEEGILAYAGEHDIDLIVLVTHGRQGLDRMLRGSTTEAVVRKAQCPVLTVRPNATHVEVEIDRIIAPVDFSEHAWYATAYARELTALFGAELHLVHVLEVLPTVGLADTPAVVPDEHRQAAARQAMQDLYHESEGPDVPVRFHVRAGAPTVEIIAAAEAVDAGLMVLSTHGHTGLARILLGSVAETMVRKSSCPVFVVRPFGRSLLRAGGPTAEEFN